jgi:hypothetical protein
MEKGQGTGRFFFEYPIKGINSLFKYLGVKFPTIFEKPKPGIDRDTGIHFVRAIEERRKSRKIEFADLENTKVAGSTSIYELSILDYCIFKERALTIKK